MVPAHAHWQVASSSKAGTPETSTGSGGSHGSAVAGTQGAGVNTPEAAEVAAITAGLVGELHMPNVLIFVSGTKSVITASSTGGAGVAATCGGPGTTVRTDGAAPMSHAICAPLATRMAMRLLSQTASLCSMRSNGKFAIQGIMIVRGRSDSNLGIGVNA